MIKDEKEYEYTQYWISRFQQSIDALNENKTLKENDPIRWQVHYESLDSHLIVLQEEITEYERLINCDKSQPLKIQVENFNKLPDVLIKARIAAKLSQKQLADILGIEEQRIKEFEDKDYQDASFSEILEVSAALGVEFDKAFVKVDFEEIEEGKKSRDKWRKWREKRQLQNNPQLSV